MATPSALPTGPRKRGNPSWGRPVKLTPAIPTAFEEEVRRLGLNEQTCACSEPLRRWCKENRNRCYIPESLLGKWGITVDTNVDS